MANTSIILTADDRTRAAFASAQNSMRGLQSAGQKLNGILSTIGVGAIAGGGLLAFVKTSIDAADNINDLSQKIGISVENLAGFNLAAESSGTSLEGIGTAAKKLNVALAEHNPLLAKLGITATDANGAMVQLADVFAGMPDGATKTAIAMKLMGKSGSEMIPMLNGGGAALDEMLRKGKELYPITTEMARAADQFNDSMAELKMQSNGVGIAIANNLLPAMNAAMSSARSASAEFGKFNGALIGLGELGTAGQTIGVLWANVAYVFKEVGLEIGGIAAQIAALGSGNFKRAGIIGDMMKRDAVIARQEIDKIEKRILGLGAKSAQAVSNSNATTKNVSSKKPPGNLFGDSNKSAKDALRRVTDTQKAEFDAAMEVENYRVEQETKALLSRRESMRQIFETGFSGDSETMAMIRAQADAINDANSAIAAGADVTGPFEAAAQRLANIRTRLDAEVNIGSKSQTAAQIELRQETGKLGDELSAKLIPRLQQLIATAPDESTREKWRAMYAEINGLQATGKQVGPFAGMKAGLDEYAKSATDTFSMVKDSVGSAFKGMEDSLTQFVMTGKMDFKSLADSIIADMVRMAIQQSITKPLAAAFSSMFIKNADGNVFNSPGLSAYSNQIVSKPTLFPFASGIGLMGEAGPEAIMPLKRGADGKLGVSGGGGVVNINQTFQVDATGADAGAVARIEASLTNMARNFKPAAVAAVREAMLRNRTSPAI